MHVGCLLGGVCSGHVGAGLVSLPRSIPMPKRGKCAKTSQVTIYNIYYSVALVCGNNLSATEV